MTFGGLYLAPRKRHICFVPHDSCEILIIDIIAGLLGFLVVRNLYVDTETHFYGIWQKCYGTLRCSGSHFRFCPPAANAQEIIQGTFIMLLTWGSLGGFNNGGL